MTYLSLQLGACLSVAAPAASLQLLQLLVGALQLQVVAHQLPVEHGVRGPEAAEGELLGGVAQRLAQRLAAR